MFKAIIYLYQPAYAKTVVYMLQAAEYNAAQFIKWYWRTMDFKRVSYRKDLVYTASAKTLLTVLRAGIFSQEVVAALLIITGLSDDSTFMTVYGIVLFLIAPILWAHLIVVPLYLGNWLIIKPLYAIKIRRSSRIFAHHPGVRIAIAGSYGKTTMKEILKVVLGEAKKVAATPANRNVSISHAQFAQQLKGDEDILIIEYGEGAPGDIARFAKKTHPSYGIITGLAPAHLDRYKTLRQAAKDIFSLAGFVDRGKLFVNNQSPAMADFTKKDYVLFDDSGINGWKVTNVGLSNKGVSFELNGKAGHLKLKSKLLGRHQIAPLVLAAYLGKAFGLSDKQIVAGITKIEPFEHRMNTYQLSGAWVIDDTYNGNIEGMKAGLSLLRELDATRKIYVTPGLVDQGAEEKRVHKELGEAICEANPDKVILMKHSVTDYILEGLRDYKGELVIEEDPLDFYTNLDKFVAAGDLVLLQNDWPDNYN
jgi:UDP-N-acetylmuramoyl-tripeptide--D-alanyl-D-alanine ligase